MECLKDFVIEAPLLIPFCMVWGMEVMEFPMNIWGHCGVVPFHVFPSAVFVLWFYMDVFLFSFDLCCILKDTLALVLNSTSYLMVFIFLSG